MAINIKGIHHVAIICSDYRRSLTFYTEKLGLTLLAENYREARDSYKADLGIGDQYIVELFSFPDPPARPSRPEAQGLRHLALAVSDIEEVIASLIDKGVVCEAIRIDEFTGRKFTFTVDPDGLPIEFYET
ncbi:VOC family protein [Sphingobacterium oryzagri]|uniref:VOC family protein n=1 Tax=Sphingobacterium oryzagri TaxID=3025669 RepID=A0ABY7WMB3_9SPHI|nr:VOC family protein [Sphingobacterium sp. KACC 22765]WDF70746.1 VOC family protein [Sphingobacterium sp. KACC 22765]